MTAVEFAVRAIDRIRESGVCLFCLAYDEGKPHAADCPAGEYERTALKAGRRFVATLTPTPTAPTDVRQKVLTMRVDLGGGMVREIAGIVEAFDARHSRDVAEYFMAGDVASRYEHVPGSERVSLEIVLREPRMRDHVAAPTEEAADPSLNLTAIEPGGDR